MSFALLSVSSLLAGIATLAVALWLAQRLRVQHREVEVLSTIFWQQALEETRARVFVRRFRHWWAWTLLAAIASLLWILLATPQTHSLNGWKHIVLVDSGIEDEQVRQDDLALALQFAASLPTSDREVIAADTELRTLLRPNEPLELANLRAEKSDLAMSPRDLTWAIEALAPRSSATTPLAIHVVGDTPIEQSRIDSLTPSANLANPSFRLQRVQRAAVEAEPMLATLGVADSIVGSWKLVDVWIAMDETDRPVEADEITVRENGAPIHSSLIRRDDGVLELRGLAANGATIDIAWRDRPLGSITLPKRTAIRVQMGQDVPETLRQLIAIDPACEIVDADADVAIGFSADDDFRLTGDDAPAFALTSEDENPEEMLADLVDRLALQQIDATSIAQHSGRVVDVQVTSGDKRTIAIWSSLFTPAFDFQESRACPTVVARSIRWLADRPPIVPWAEVGQRLPESSPEFGRVLGRKTMTDDGRTLHGTRLASQVNDVALLPQSNIGSFLARVGPLSWIGLVVALLLVGEWVLYQRGHIP